MAALHVPPWRQHGGRPNRGGAERRQQLLRHEARTAARLIAGFASIDAHRGNTVSRTGSLFRDALRIVLRESDGTQTVYGDDAIIDHGHSSAEQWSARQAHGGDSEEVNPAGKGGKGDNDNTPVDGGMVGT